MTRHANDEVLALSRRYLEMVEGRELSLDEKQAFIAAEDKNFYKHMGIDPEGIVRAVVDSRNQPALRLFAGLGLAVRARHAVWATRAR